MTTVAISADFAIRVEATADQRGEPTPRRFYLGTRRVEVSEVLDRWLGSDRSYYKVRATDGDLYILLHEPGIDRWELTLFSSGATGPLHHC
jgi:hypothetical protein